MSWVNLQISGRDVTILGEASDRAILQKTITVISETSGVRKVVNAAKIRVWRELSASTVTFLEMKDRSPRISGTWPTDSAVGLSVELDGRFYVLNEAEELQIDGAT